MILTDDMASDLINGLRKIFDRNILQIILFGSAARMEDV